MQNFAIMDLVDSTLDSHLHFVQNPFSIWPVQSFRCFLTNESNFSKAVVIKVTKAFKSKFFKQTICFQGNLKPCNSFYLLPSH